MGQVHYHCISCPPTVSSRPITRSKSRDSKITDQSFQLAKQWRDWAKHLGSKLSFYEIRWQQCRFGCLLATKSISRSFTHQQTPFHEYFLKSWNYGNTNFRISLVYSNRLTIQKDYCHWSIITNAIIQIRIHFQFQKVKHFFSQLIVHKTNLQCGTFQHWSSFSLCQDVLQRTESSFFGTSLKSRKLSVFRHHLNLIRS